MRLLRRFMVLAGFLAGANVPLLAAEIWRLDSVDDPAGQPWSVVGKPQAATVSGRKAVVFDGAHDGLFVTGNPAAGAPTFTIEVLFWPAADGPAEQRFFHVQDADGRRLLLETRVNGRGGWWLDGFMRTSMDSADKGLALIDPTLVHPTGRWYWVALRYDGQRLATFVNGVKELEGERAFSPLGDGTISIGVRQNHVYWFKGAIGEVRFHREAMAESALQRKAE